MWMPAVMPADVTMLPRSIQRTFSRTSSEGKRIRKSELADIQARFQVISVRLVAGDPVVHVYSEAPPGDGFTAVEPLLEDVYMHRVGAVALAEA